MPQLSHDLLQSFVCDLLAAGGAESNEAAIVAESLVGANLRGCDSHGVMRIPQYIEAIRGGEIRPGQTLTIVQETPALLVGDGGWGFGQVLARNLSQRLIDRSRAMGIAAGTLRRSAHIGRLGEYAEIAAEAGLLAIILANTHGRAQRVAPLGGIRPRLGTNPICLGSPGGAEGPFVLDFGTSATAEGKVRLARIAGESVPPGWLLDAEGKATEDPNTLYGDPPGTILPAGGDQAYKGFGLAMLIELFCSGLSGAPTASASPRGPRGNAVFFLFICPDGAAGAEHLADEARALERYLRDVPRRRDVEEIVLPGDPERESLARRARDGIEIETRHWDALVESAEALGVTPPSI